MPLTTFDIIIIGAGIAGASVAAHLSTTRKVAILEMEGRPGYHTTGRSAASYEPNYGPPPMLAFTRASDTFFRNPPKGFTDSPLLNHRDSLFFEAKGQEQNTISLLALSAGLKEISEHDAKQRFPILRDGYAKRSFLDPQTGDIDVDLLHRGYLKLFKENGGILALKAKAERIEFINSHWHIATKAGDFRAPLIINAAGAWGDVIAQMASVAPVGLIPKRRSIGIIPIRGQGDFSAWPMVTDVGETWYAKPQSGKLMVSSADATPVEPHDAYGDDMAIAEGIERLMNATTLEVERLDHNWGGLRTFAPDGNPVIGFDPNAQGFFWLVGQGGYGIQSCPALSLSASHLVLGGEISNELRDYGLNPDHMTPNRFRY
jgi:D-arginine dehydrogenase